ncbi:Kae1-associated kinase Bud32 [Thermococci archaeon]|nr:MAG: Kae1-associated kinase Bud32 [Thermococci archaeon]
MQIIARGAEALLYVKELEGKKVLVKDRVKKGYRIEQIDKMLRKIRTRKEVKLLREARKIGVHTPQVIDVDEKNYRIVMEYVEGKRLKELLNSADIETIKRISYEIGRIVGRLHANGIVHGDLTTSNMILSNGKIYLLDFSLGAFSKRIEDQGVDLNLLFESLKATHFKILKVCWDNIVKGYKEEYKKAEEALKRAIEIEKRARYVEREE